VVDEESAEQSAEVQSAISVRFFKTDMDIYDKTDYQTTEY
jgi:hypothetical protein